jgi:large subunit ribosomal protein L22
MRTFIKYSPQKLWYPAFMIRGMSIDEAIKQLSFHKLKGAAIIKEVTYLLFFFEINFKELV